jgi:TFIIF-interacting CTD phosphatase-like protein
LEEFLEVAAKQYTIVIFTASREHYAKAVVERIDPKKKYVQMVLSKKDCIVTKDFAVVKDLRLFKGWKLEDIIIVDNLVQSFACQLDNGIPILPFTGGKDEELHFLGDFLRKCADSKDCRLEISARINLRKKILMPQA